MAYSYQSVVSNGTLTTLLLSFDYTNRSEISVFFDGVLNTGWSWVGLTEKQIQFASAVPAGVVVTARRSTDLSAPKHIFSVGAQFKASAIDANTKQLLNAAQELRERDGFDMPEMLVDLDMRGFKVRNVGTAVDSGDAISKGQLAGATGAALVGAGVRTQAAKNAEWLSIKDFGAVGDGVADDTGAIQAALAAGSGRVVFFPRGTYKVSGTMLIRTRCQLLGEGATVILAAGFPASSPVFSNYTTTGSLNTYYDTGISISGLVFDGNNNAARTSPMLGFDKASNVRVCYNDFVNHTGIVISVGACRNVSIERNVFMNNGRPKPSAVSAPCIWTDSGAWGTPYNVSIERNEFRSNNWSCAYFMPTGGSFSFNTCVGNGESGVFSNQNGFNLKYIGNHIEGQLRSNISASGIETGAQHIQISGNFITGCGADGISLTDVQNAGVSGNTVFNNGQDPYFATPSGIGIGTLIAPGCDHINITANRIGDRQGTKTQAYGVTVGGGGPAAQRISISGNDLTEQKTGSFNLQAGKWSSTCLVKDNVLSDGNLSAAVKYVEFYAPASPGNFAVTGVGFRPRAIEIMAIEPASNVRKSDGVFDGTTQRAHWLAVDASGSAASKASSAVINLCDSAAALRCVAAVVSLDTDGFTLSFTTTTSRPWCVAKCYP